THPAVRACNDVFAAYQASVEDNAISHPFWTFNDVTGVTDHTWNQDLPFRQFDFLPKLPFMLVPRIRRLDCLCVPEKFLIRINPKIRFCAAPWPHLRPRP